MDEFILEQISDSDPMVVLEGVVRILRNIQDRQIPFPFSTNLFHKIIPLLDHNNYKIKARSFSIVEILFLKNANELTDVVCSIPVLILSLGSINSSIVKSANVCLKVIFESFDINIWWDYVENNILYGKSLTVRSQLLALLGEIPTKVPLSPIITLLDDKNIRIRNLAEKIFLNAGDDRIRQSLQDAKISFDVYQKYYLRFFPTQTNSQFFTMTNEDETTNIQGLKKETTTDKTMNNQDNLERQENQNLEQNEIKKTDSLLVENMNSETKTDQETANNEAATKSNANSIYQRLKLNPQPGKISTNTTQSHLSQVSLTDRSEIDKNFVPPLGRKTKTNQSPSTIEPDELELLDDSDDDYDESSKKRATLGNLVKKPNKQSSQFHLRDMTKFNWFERLTFLERFDELYSSDCLYFTQKPTDVVKCLLTASFPLHKKVSPLLASLLSRYIFQNPEVLHSMLIDVVRFLLHAIRPPASLTNENGAGDLLDAILYESSPDELIDAALNVKKENQRPLMIEELVLMMLNRKSEISLSQISIRNLLCYLLHSNANSSSIDELLFLIGKRETSEVIKFYQYQSKDIKRKLLYYIPKEEIAKYKKKNEQTEPKVQIKDISHENLGFIVDQELKKGSKCNYNKLLLALSNFQIEDESFADIYFSFLICTGKMAESTIEKNDSLLCDVCCGPFNSDAVFSIFNRQFIQPELLRGFRIFVWHCSMRLLRDTSQYYDKLYQIFKDGDGNIRKQVVGISIAFEKVNNESILNVNGMISQHKALIQNLIRQYEIV